jgi:predicted dehydrogenase
MAHVGHMVTGGHIVCAAAFEPSDERFELACKHFEAQPKRYASVRAMVENEALDGVIIASPNHCHLDNLRELEGAKLPVLLEKPLDASWEKICAVVEFARAYAGPVVVCHVMRYTPLFRRAKALLDQGVIGKLRSVRFTQNCYYGNGMFHNWRRERSKGGTMMIEKATHDLDLMQWLLGAKPVSVFASTKQQAFGGDKPNDRVCNACDERLTCPESDLNLHYAGQPGYAHVNGAMPCCFAKAADVPDDEMCLIQYDSGVHASYIATYYTPACYQRSRVVQLVGLDGVMEVVENTASTESELIVYPRYGKPGEHRRETFNPMGRGHQEGDFWTMRHFYDIIVHGVAPESTVEQALLAEAAGYAAMRSSDEHREVRLDEILP